MNHSLFTDQSHDLLFFSLPFSFSLSPFSIHSICLLDFGQCFTCKIIRDQLHFRSNDMTFTGEHTHTHTHTHTHSYIHTQMAFVKRADVNKWPFGAVYSVFWVSLVQLYFVEGVTHLVTWVPFVHFFAASCVLVQAIRSQWSAAPPPATPLTKVEINAKLWPMEERRKAIHLHLAQRDIKVLYSLLPLVMQLVMRRRWRWRGRVLLLSLLVH